MYMQILTSSLAQDSMWIPRSKNVNWLTKGLKLIKTGIENIDRVHSLNSVIHEAAIKSHILDGLACSCI